MVLVQKWTFFQLFFLSNIGQKNVFYDILEQENSSLRYKNRKFKKIRSSKSLKIDIFPKGLTHGFGPKMYIFPTFFFLGNIGQKKVFCDILQRENAFQRYKKRKVKKSKN